MELSRSKCALIVPACLNEDHFTDDGAFWDPERWFMAAFDKVRARLLMIGIMSNVRPMRKSRYSIYL